MTTTASLKVTRAANTDVETARKVWVALNREMVAAGIAKPGHWAKLVQFELSQLKGESTWRDAVGYVIDGMVSTAEQKLTVSTKTGKAWQVDGFGRNRLENTYSYDKSAFDALCERVMSRLS